MSLQGEPCEAAPGEKTISILNGTKIGKEGYSPQKSDLDLVNEWVGPAPSAPKKETAAVKEQPPKAKVEKKAPSAESKTDAEIRQDMKKKLFKKFADDKKVKQQQKLP